MAALLYFVLGMLLAVHRGEAIKCWNCNSNTDSKCGDPFDNRTMVLTDCSSSQDGLNMRYCSKIRIDVNGHYVYYRSCSHTEGLCPDAVGSGHCATCDSDGCNSAPGTNLLPGLLLAAFIPIALLRH
ncbi:UPAR/Ly6 domain-containing protein crok [Anabrus simplex]|uniref:UPAR/Ly6 domain-containing protein crok n=1 Tax=Anabrus simplex TaxID=316456 RepID=UPI0035A2DD19